MAAVVKRGSAWRVIVDWDRDPVTGKRKQVSRTVKGTKRDAQKVGIDLENQRDKGAGALQGRLTVSEWLQQWLETYAKTLAPKTYRRYEELIRRHVLPMVGSLQLVKLTPAQIERAYGEARTKLAPRTVLHVHRVLHKALKDALRLELVNRNAADVVQSPKADRHEVRSLLPGQEIHGLLSAAASTPFGPLVHVALSTGLRQGELLGLRWQDVDLPGATLSVRQTCQWLPKAGFSFKTPKNGKGRRVDLSDATVDSFTRQRAQQLAERMKTGRGLPVSSDLVFTDALGSPLSPHGALRSTWKRIREAAGLTGLRFHDLRHTHASLMLADDVHPKIVSERLGHSTVGITLNTYSHVMPTLQAAAAARFDRFTTVFPVEEAKDKVDARDR